MGRKPIISHQQAHIETHHFTFMGFFALPILRFFIYKMTNYRRLRLLGGCYFFTVNLAQRKDNNLLIEHVDVLRESFRKVKTAHPFDINAIVILPEHLHCIWTLPEGDSDYSNRWRQIKSAFSKALPAVEYRSKSRLRKKERGIWQRRFWEHLIRDDKDYANHVDYIHYNPIKHGYVKKLKDWRYSSFHRYTNAGLYPPNWCDNSRIENMIIQGE